jgi:2-oxoglutarate dehydrogenase E1 component
MSSSDLQNEWASSYLSGGSMAYVDSLYEDYLADPDSVSADWQKVFSSLAQVNGTGADRSHRDIRDYFLQNADKKRAHIIQSEDNSQQYQVANLVNNFRSVGHLAAKLDPLKMTQPAVVPGLDLATHQLADTDKSRTFFSGTHFNGPEMSLGDIYQALSDTYCGSIGIEYMHISNKEEIDWLQQRMESARGRPNFDAAKKLTILKDLIAADGLERYLGTRYVGQKRFSLEGGDSLIPMMNEIINNSGRDGVKELVIGMAHRGRLNVLVNVLGKNPGDLFNEFEGKVSYDRTGDVKYHLGFSSDIQTDSGSIVHVALAFNPSHLEIISPVVEGSARSRLERRNDLAEKNTVVPILLHGDAAFSGQGVVMETFNFSQARGYCTGGSIHIVINNQIGFTTSNPMDSRSTLYCTDIAKMVHAPVLHVNGDDPEAVVFATQIAFDFRMKFKRDVVIDLMCYRRNGHNEADEPAVTQPTMYKKIKSMRPLRELYAEHLVTIGSLAAGEADKMIERYRDGLDQGKSVVDLVHESYEGKSNVDWTPYLNAKWTDKAETTISKDNLLKLTEQLNKLPPNFQLHPVVQRLLTERDKMTAGEIPMNWGYAETMAYASLLQEGYGVRLSGQDCGRGTFAHRHAVLHDINTGEVSIPLEQISTNPPRSFTVIDSVLSEEAVLAFEYGYASSEPSSLVLWEAQFGDLLMERK